MRKALAGVVLGLASLTAMAGTWQIDWSEQSKYLDPAEQVTTYYLAADSTGPGYAQTAIYKTAVPEKTSLCVKVYEKGGFFSGATAKVHFINLSRIEKIEALGSQSQGGEQVGVERYTLKGGVTLDVAQLKTGGDTFACSLNEKGEMLVSKPRWDYYEIEGKAPGCVFDDDKAKNLKLGAGAVFNAQRLSTSNLTLGFNLMPRGYVQRLDHSQADVQKKFDGCGDGTAKVAGFLKSQEQDQAKRAQEYIRAFGDPVAKEADRVNALLGKPTSKPAAAPLGLAIGEASASRVKEVIGAKATLESPRVAEINGVEGCMGANLLDLQGVLTVSVSSNAALGIDSLQRVLFCFDKGGTLHRVDMRMAPSTTVAKAVLEGLAKKYKLVSKTVSKGRTAEEAARLSNPYRKPLAPIEPYVDSALFVQGDTVIEYGFKQDDVPVLFTYEKFYVTYMTRKLYLESHKAAAQAKLNLAIAKWDAQRNAAPKSDPF